MRITRAPVIALLALLYSVMSWPECVSAQRITYSTREILEGLNSPWEMREGPDGWLYFTERPGSFSKVNPESGESKVLLRPKNCLLWHEAGMLGFDFHSNFPDSPFVYIAYVYGSGLTDSSGNVDAAYGLFRYTSIGDTLVDGKQLFGPAKALYSHNGSRVLVKDDKVYFTIGEVWQFEIAQDKTDLNGKIHRINVDGSIPDDNPVANSPMWTLGHRNPQGLAEARNGTLYSTEHGDWTDDELNIIEKGRNYGWPRVHGFCDSASDADDCESLDIHEPVEVWTPTLAVGDIEYYDAASFPEWKHSILLTTLKDASLHHLKLDSAGLNVLDQQRYELVDSNVEPYGRLRSICQTRDGRIYIGTGNGTHRDVTVDKIFELVRTGIEPASVELIAPAVGDSLPYSDLSLRWRQPYYQGLYNVQLSLDSTFEEDRLFLNWPASDTNVKVIDLKPKTKYFWRVRDKKSEGPWSEVRSFYTLSTPTDPKIPTESDGPLYAVRGRARSIVIVSNTARLRASVEVIDVLGRLRSSINIDDLSMNTEFTVGSFEAGAYFVRITTAQGVVTHQIQVR